LYVFVTVTELEGQGREQDLGNLPDTTPLQRVKDRVLMRIETQLPPDARGDPRHFWHNDRIQPNNALLTDLASGNDIVSLELRRDLYRIATPGGGNELAAFNPEETASAFIRNAVQNILQRKHGAECCYELRLAGGDALDPDQDLFAQRTFPQANLALRRRRVYYAWSAGLLGLAVAVGLLFGYLSGWVW